MFTQQQHEGRIRAVRAAVTEKLNSLQQRYSNLSELEQFSNQFKIDNDTLSEKELEMKWHEQVRADFQQIHALSGGVNIEWLFGLGEGGERWNYMARNINERPNDNVRRKQREYRVAAIEAALREGEEEDEEEDDGDYSAVSEEQREQREPVQNSPRYAPTSSHSSPVPPKPKRRKTQ